MATIEEALAVERLEKDIFRGAVVKTHLQRTFGGQVAGQALVAAVRTVSPEFQVHSLHGYFLRPGNPDAPTVYLVDRIRDGRSFVTRRVTGVQDGKAIFTMSSSFHVGDVGIEHQDDMPKVVPPEDLPDSRDLIPDRGEWMSHWDDWDIRIIPGEQLARRRGIASQQQVWFRYRGELPDDPVFHVCTLTYMSDMTLIGSANAIHPNVDTQVASLDHALWFMRPFRADEWLLYDQTSPSAGMGRALAQGRIYNQDGAMVAAVVQEGLQRLLRTDGAS
ncbi:acyl-CoA thioesterase [Aldersonia kunmingensis]|uniref:acyl-CoA thioesterase n=1 Tax=Aldersonia kunmingensis TaxID=408066 RepID=UPI000833B8EF|nr:acyl-CoA thioesterase II [Aldersonia kunmingensis]